MPSQSPHFAADGPEAYVVFWLPPEAGTISGSSERLSSGEVTLLLKAWSGGEQAALDKLTPLVEQELHRLAHKFMAQEKPGHTLQTTALVNEVYLRLVNVHELTWQDRAHFFAISALDLDVDLITENRTISENRTIEKPTHTAYRLLKKLGEGGMGQVWLAEQTSPVRRQVALKLIRAGMYNELVVQPFQAERQSLAIMDIPRSPRFLTPEQPRKASLTS